MEGDDRAQFPAIVIVKRASTGLYVAKRLTFGRDRQIYTAKMLSAKCAS
jgi:hypothetical protein